MIKKILVFATICSFGLACNAQENLIPSEVKGYELQIGDTIIFKYATPEVSIKPHYFGWVLNSTDYSNLDHYLEGYMSNHYQTAKKKRDTYGGYVYHADYSQGNSQTPLADIDGKTLIVLGTSRFSNTQSGYAPDSNLKTRLLMTLLFLGIYNITHIQQNQVKFTFQN